MKFTKYLISFLCMACAFSACSDDDETMLPTVQNIKLSETQKTVSVGDKWQITAQVLPEDAVNKNVIWSNLHPEVGSIDEAGNVIAVGVGTDSIFATVDNVKALCIMKVKAIEVESITLNEEAKVLGVGDVLQLTATIAPANATVTQLAWESSEPKVATVDKEGKVSALAEGKAIITVSCGKVSAKCELTIVNNKLVMSPAACELKIGATQELSLTVPPRLQGKTVEWKSLNEELVSVAVSKENPLKATVTAVKPGVAEVEANIEGEAVKCAVTVLEPEGKLELVETQEVRMGEEVELVLNVPERLKGEPVVWASSKAEVASVTASDKDQTKAVVAGLTMGTTEITATVKGESVKCVVTVLEPAGKLELAETLEVTVGSNAELKLSVPERLKGETVKWESSNAGVVTVEKKADNQNKAIVTGVAVGTAEITATVKGESVKCVVTVKEPEGKLELVETLEVSVGGNSEIKLTVPARLKGETVKWESSNAGVATVEKKADNQNKAIVTGVAVGTAEITATVKGESVKCVVTVKEPEGKLEISAAEVKVEMGTVQHVQLTVPARLEGKTIEWKSLDPTIATVDADATDAKVGVVKPVKVGETEIQATIEGETVSCKVIVTKSDVLVEGTVATIRLNLMADENAVAAKIKELDAQGVKEYRLIGDFHKLGKVVVKKDQILNVFANTKVEIIDFSGIDPETLPKVEVTKGGEKLPGLVANAFDSGKDVNVQLFSALKKIILPEGLKVIGTYAFQGCRTLEEVVAPGVTAIGGYAFGYCPSLLTVKLTAPAAITSGDKAFPKSVVEATLYLNESNKGMVDGTTVFERAWKEVIFVK